MKKLLAVALLALAPTVARAQHTLSCPGATLADHTCDGLSTTGAGGLIGDGILYVVGEGGTAYLYSPTGTFDFVSAYFRSFTASPNHILVAGYSREVVDAPFSGFPWGGGGNVLSGGGYSYLGGLTATPDQWTPATFNWTNVAAVAFDGTGGPPTGCVGVFCTDTRWDYEVGYIAVAGPTLTPEPTSLVLVGSGLLVLLGVARRRLTRAA